MLCCVVFDVSYRVNDVTVSIMGSDDISQTMICENTNTTIEFLSEMGDLPLMTLNFTDLDHTTNNWMNSYVLNVTEFRKGKHYVSLKSPCNVPKVSAKRPIRILTTC